MSPEQAGPNMIIFSEWEAQGYGANVWGTSLFGYYLTITSWPITELKSIDQKAR